MSDTALAKSTIVLAFDRLGASHLGPFGNTWCETSAFNRIAADSVVFDRMIADSTRRQSVLRSLWTGVHAASSADGLADHVARVAAMAGGKSVLISDEPAVCNDPLAEEFDRVVLVETPGKLVTAVDVADTEAAHFFAQAIELVSRLEPGDFYWIHSRGLAGGWDAPLEYRRRLTGPDDPEPGHFVAAPVDRFDESVDSPDKLLQFQVACAAQVSVLDELTAVFLEQIDERSVTRDAAFSCLGLAGYELGEHGPVGPTDGLHNSAIHLPCFWRTGSDRTCSRRLGIRQPADWHRVFNSWVLGAAGDHAADVEGVGVLPDRSVEAAISISPSCRAIETHAWKLICDDNRRQLFVRPDDGWEINDVIDRCEPIADELEACLNEQIRQMQAGERSVQVQLEDHLVVTG